MALAPSFGPASSDCRRDVLWKREPLDGAAPASTPGSACEVRRSAVPVRAPEPPTLPDSGFRPAPSSSPYLLRQDRHPQTTRVNRTFQYVFVLTAPPPFPSPKPANQLLHRYPQQRASGIPLLSRSTLLWKAARARRRCFLHAGGQSHSTQRE